MAEKSKSSIGEQICALDVGTSKIVALIAEVDEDERLRVIGAGRVPAHGLRRGVVINTVEAQTAIAQAIAEAEGGANQVMNRAYVGIAGSHINAIGSKAAVAIGRGRNITRDDAQRALEQAQNIAVPHNRDIIHAVPRSYAVDDQKNIQNPIGMFGFRLEVDASIITGAASAITNLVNCVRAQGIEVTDLVLQPLASAEAALTDDERRLGVALVDIGAGTTDLAIYLEGAPWHTNVLDIGGDYFIRDLAMGLRMPYDRAEELMKQHGTALPDQVPADATVRWDAFGQQTQQPVNRRLVAEILNARAEEVIDMVTVEVKRSGYDGLLPAGVVLTGGVSQLNGFTDLSRAMLQWPVRVGRPTGVANSVMDLNSPEYATAVGLLLWGLRQDTVPRVPLPPPDSTLRRVMRWIRGFIPIP